MNNNPIFSNAVGANGIFEVAENHPSLQKIMSEPKTYCDIIGQITFNLYF